MRFLGIRLNFITPSDQAKFEDLFSRAAASTGSNKLPGKVDDELNAMGCSSKYLLYDSYGCA